MTTPTTTAPPTSAPERNLKIGSLTTSAIVFMVIAAAAPLTVIGGGLPIGISAGNGAGFPAMYAFGAVILILFSVGLTTMAKHIAEPGAFYSYVESAFGKYMGMGTAYLALLTYTAIQFAVYGLLGQELATFAHPLIPAPWWLWTLAVVVVVGLLGYRNIELSSKALGILLIAEIAIVIIIDIAVIAQGGQHGLDAQPFMPDHIFSGSVGVGLMMALSGFIGFESTTVFRGEAKNPDETIPRATYISVFIIGAFYTLSGWAVVEAWGVDNVLTIATTNPEGMIAETANHYVGTWAGMTVHVLLLTSLFACVLSFHNVLTRYQHAISRKSGLPKALGNVHPRHFSPHLSSIVQTITILALLAICIAADADPVVQVFTWLSGLATFTIVILMALTSASVLLYFSRHPEFNVGPWKRIIAPTLAFLGLGVCLYYIITNLTMLVGGDATIATILGYSAPAVFILGMAVKAVTEKVAR